MASKRTIKRHSLPDAIASDIRERILCGQMAEGEVIRQDALAQEYDVSRMPVREALKRLDAEGLVQFTINRGASVTKHSLKEIGEVFDLRILIEVDLFRRSIPAMTASDHAKCEGILNAMEASYEADDVAKWGALNFDYHSALYAAADRKLTNDILQSVSQHSDRYVRMHLSVMKQLESACKDHRDLLVMAMERDVDAGCALLRGHIERTKDQLLKRVEENRAG